MMKIQWEYDLAERPFCEQLKAMGWQWMEGDMDVPDFTERQNFREVLLRGRLTAALRKLNRRDGQPWLDDDRIRRIIEKLEKAEGHRLMEINESATKMVLVDEAHRSHTRTLHRNLRKALPNAVIIGFTGTPILSHEKKETREIFGDFIDKYILQDAELDGATVPILYEGRTADGIVKDAAQP
jgi:type I site-specific restriction-modification system R (restriction) subunit